MAAQGTTDRIIRASEVAQYAYCAHAWWLGSVEGRPSAHRQEMAAGDIAHQRHGRRVRIWVILTRLAYLLLALAMVAAVVALLEGV